MVRVTGLFHAALAVWDLERAERFYREIFGLRRHATPSYFPGNVVFLDLGNTMLHLIRDAPGMPRTTVGGAADDGDDEAAFLRRQEQARRLRLHLALAVDDLDAALDRVRAAGRPITTEIATRPDGSRYCYFLDTEQNRVELVQP